jgi:hypothetical protein
MPFLVWSFVSLYGAAPGLGTYLSYFFKIEVRGRRIGLAIRGGFIALLKASKPERIFRCEYQKGGFSFFRTKRPIFPNSHFSKIPEREENPKLTEYFFFGLAQNLYILV